MEQNGKSEWIEKVWTAKRELAKINYHKYTDAIKKDSTMSKI